MPFIYQAKSHAVVYDMEDNDPFYRFGHLGVNMGKSMELETGDEG